MNKEIKLILDGLKYLIEVDTQKRSDAIMFKRLWFNSVDKLLNPKVDSTLSNKTKEVLSDAPRDLDEVENKK